MWALLLGSATLVGLVAGLARPLDQPSLVLAGAASALGLALRPPLALPRGLALTCLACVLGALRASLWPEPTSDGLTPLLGARVALRGQVITPPTARGESVSFRLAVRAAGRLPAPRAGPPHLEPLDAQVEVRARADDVAASLQLGDRVFAEGRLAEPWSPAGYPRAEQLRRQGVFATLPSPRLALEAASAGVDPATAPLALRTAVTRAIRSALPEPQASLSAGLLLGGSGDLSPAFRQQLQASGLSHLVAVDGYKQVVVAGAWSALVLRLVGRQRSLLPVLLGIAAYTVLTGAPPSAVRAGLMVGLAVAAGAVGRVADPLTGLVVAATAMGMAKPAVLLEVSFQLSFAATLGLILLLPRFRRALERLPPWLAEQAGITLAATLATLPVSLLVFRQTSLISPLAHVLAVPLVPAVMLSAGLLGLTPLVPAAAGPVAWLAWVPTTALAQVVRFAAAVPGASVFTGHVPTAGAVALAAALLAWGCAGLPEAEPLRVWMGRLTPGRLRPGRATSAVWAVAGLLAVLLLARPDGYLHVTAIGSGRGQATLLRGPGGRTVLVSGEGVDPRGLASLVGDALNAWERSLSAVVVLDPAHEPSLSETLRRYPAASRLGADREARLDLGGGAALDVYPDDGDGPAVAVSYADVWLRLVGRPPPPRPADGSPVAVILGDGPGSAEVPQPFLRVGPRDPRTSPVHLVPAPREAALELVSDGETVWPADEATAGQLGLPASPAGP